MEISYLSLAITIITSTCISGGIVGIIITFILERIASRIDGRFEQRLNKELENYKNDLDKKRYITKAQFDKEFEIYHELCHSFFLMIVKLSSITEKQLNVSDLQDTKRNTIINSFKQFVYVICEAQNKLYENAAFIPEQLYNSFYEVYDAASGEFWVINDRLDKAINGEKCDDILISQDDHEIAKAIETMNQKLNYDLRQYLESLAVVE